MTHHHSSLSSVAGSGPYPVYGYYPYIQAGLGPYPYTYPYPGYPGQGLAASPAEPLPAARSGHHGFLTGLLAGAAAAYLLTNEGVQQTAIHTAVRGWSLLRGGLEELKERFRDAEAELQAARHQD